MRSTRTTRGLLLGLSVGLTLAGAAGSAWGLLGSPPPCDDGDAEGCLAQTAARRELMDFTLLAGAILGTSGALLGLVARDLYRRAREGATP